MKNYTKLCLVALASLMVGCGSQEVPAAHKGRLFDKTGALALWSGGHGFEGPILGPGTYYTGVYDEVRTIDCGQHTKKEPLQALTKDGVQFSLDVYVSYGAACDKEASIKTLLEQLSPEKDTTINATQIYNIFIRPAIGEAVREAVSPVIANDVNAKREEIFENVKKSFQENLKKQQLVTIYTMNLSNLDFPDAMDAANVARAAQAIEKDKAIAAREKVEAEILTAKLEITKTEVEAQAEAKKIDTIGAALHRNPEYYVRDVYYYAAQHGGSVMVPQDPKYIMQITPKGK